MSIFILAISCLTTSNLPWFMDLTFQVSMLRNHIHNQVLFLLWFILLILSGAISMIFSSSILGTYWSGEFIFQCHIFLLFYSLHGVLKVRILKWFAIPFSMKHAEKQNIVNLDRHEDVLRSFLNILRIMLPSFRMPNVSYNVLSLTKPKAISFF